MKVGLMCTDGLRKEGIYEQYFSKVAPEVEVIYPSEEGQRLVTKGICNAKNANRYLDKSEKEHPFYCFTSVCDEFERRGVDCIVGGCTDISNAFTIVHNDKFLYIDSLEVLADVIFNNNKNLMR